MKNEILTIYNYILNGQFDERDKTFLIYYLTKKIRLSIEEESEISVQSILSDLKILNDDLSNCSISELTTRRIKQEIELLKDLNKIMETEDEIKLLDISYRLDKLYYENQLPFRNTNTVYRKIENDLKGKK